MSGEQHTKQLLSDVYPQLRRMAAARMARQSADHTLQPTALVHEVWLRLSSHQSRTWMNNVPQFFAAAAKTMRRILIDRARRRAEQKHGGGWFRLPMEAAESISVSTDEKILLVDEALGRLEKENPSYAQVVMLKVFGGLSNAEIAQAMGLTERTVYRYWSHAKAWLYDEILLQR
jgi:RNA polymerase sigma factor (TIGR02999 family)